MSDFSATDKTTITRLPKRGNYDQKVVYDILDEALFCTIAYVRSGEAFQIPTGFCRIGDTLYIHGSVGSFYMRDLAEHKKNVCISVTLLDGLVLARSAFHHSANYRSVVLFSQCEKISEQKLLYSVMETFTNKMQPGRFDIVRKPNDTEWKATAVLAFKINEASAKIRTGPPVDDEEDYRLNVWAGVVPLKLQRLTPLEDLLKKESL